MNKAKTFRLAALFMGIMATLGLAACGDDDNGNSDNGGSDNGGYKTVTLSRKTNYGNDWIYYSLSQGKEVEVNEDSHATDLSWDLAFNRYNIRTNSGTSGNGHGGAYDTGQTNFDAVLSVPSGAKFTVDVNDSITASFTGSGITQIASSLSPVLADAIAFAGPPPSYTPNNHVYIVRTADGRYAKLQVLGFYNDEGQSGYMNFKYAYQPDDSTNLDLK